MVDMLAEHGVTWKKQAANSPSMNPLDLAFFWSLQVRVRRRWREFEKIVTLEEIKDKLWVVVQEVSVHRISVPRAAWALRGRSAALSARTMAFGAARR